MIFRKLAIKKSGKAVIFFMVIALLPTFTKQYSSAIAAQSQEIKSPFTPVFNVKKDIPDRSCSSPPSAPQKLIFQSIYTDRSEGVSIVDEKARALYKEQIKPIESFEKKIAENVDRILRNKEEDNDYCAINWMLDWSAQNALLTRQANGQGEAIRKWFLATIATHYNLLNQNINLPKKAQKQLERWIDRLAKQVVLDYSKNPNSSSRKNNHIYWSAWAVMMASTILDNHEYYNWAKERAEIGILEIRENGILPRELVRQRRAFLYHVFAAAPLVLIAETMKQNNDDLYNVNNGGLHRLVNLVLSELQNEQSFFTMTTGKTQNTTNTITHYSLAWLTPYNQRFPKKIAGKWIEKLEPMKARRLGGNLSVLFPNSIDQSDK